MDNHIFLDTKKAVKTIGVRFYSLFLPFIYIMKVGK